MGPVLCPGVSASPGPLLKTSSLCPCHPPLALQPAGPGWSWVEMGTSCSRGRSSLHAAVPSPGQGRGHLGTALFSSCPLFLLVFAEGCVRVGVSLSLLLKTKPPLGAGVTSCGQQILCQSRSLQNPPSLGQAGCPGDQIWYSMLKSSELRSQTSLTMVPTSHRVQLCFQSFCTQTRALRCCPAPMRHQQ